MKSTLYIQNLKSEGGETTIINRLSELKGISNIIIKFQYATVTFEHDNKEDIDRVKHMLSKIGYPPFGEKNDIYKKTNSL